MITRKQFLGLTLGVVAAAIAFAQVKGESASVTLPFASAVKIEVKDGYRLIESNGIPNHSVGQFPGKGNPNKIAPQSYSFRVPVKPKPSEVATRAQVFGVAVNGIVFDPGTAELWNNDMRWHYEALSGALGSRNSLGVDENLAHVQPNGAYHYHGLPRGLLNKLDYKNKMALVGWAADGYPIYGPYCYSNPTDASSPLKQMSSGYRLKDGQRTGDGPGGVYDGSFASDYEYVKGDLDKFNGRTGVTPEFPNGTFYYVLTENWPYIPREFKGTPDPSFSRGGPGPGGPNQGQGRPPQQGGPPRGMVPADALADYLDLSTEQKTKLDEFKKTVEALNAENFAMGEFAQLKLTRDQIHKIGTGSRIRQVLTPDQIKILEQFQRRGGPPPSA